MVAVPRPAPAAVVVALGEAAVTLEPGFRSAHLLIDLCAALAAARALGVAVRDGELAVTFSGLGERLSLPAGVLVINDCYKRQPDVDACRAGRARDRRRRPARRGARRHAGAGRARRAPLTTASWASRRRLPASRC